MASDSTSSKLNLLLDDTRRWLHIHKIHQKDYIKLLETKIRKHDLDKEISVLEEKIKQMENKQEGKSNFEMISYHDTQQVLSKKYKKSIEWKNLDQELKDIIHHLNLDEEEETNLLSRWELMTALSLNDFFTRLSENEYEILSWLDMNGIRVVRYNTKRLPMTQYPSSKKSLLLWKIIPTVCVGATILVFIKKKYY